MKKLLSLLVALICAITVNATELFMVGDATPAGWDLGAALNTQQMEEVSTNVFEWTGVLAANSGEGFKILAGRDWNPGLHPSEAALKIDLAGQDVVALPYSGDPDTKWQVSVTGNYTIRVTLRTDDALVECIEAGAVTVDVPCVDGVYQLSTATHAANFADGINSGTIENTCSVVLANDLDLASIEKWVAIGTDSKKFMGTFDGQGHRILNMNIDGSKKEQGFFGVVGPGALIKNTIIDASCVIISTTGECMAAFVGCVNNDGTITFENCGNEANVVGTKQNNAAFVGCNYGGGCHLVFNNCYNVGKISGGWENGAFSGWCGGGAQFFNCYNAGEVTEGETWARGNKEMNNCYQTVGADGGVNQIDAAALASGELCVLLNNETDVWKQTLGEAAYPVFTGKTVYALGDAYANIDNVENAAGNAECILPSIKWGGDYKAYTYLAQGDFDFGDWNTGNPNYNVIIGTPAKDAAEKDWFTPGYVMGEGWAYDHKLPEFGDGRPADVYAVRYFTVDGEIPSTLYMPAAHDDAPCEYYINGVKIWSETDGWKEDEVVRLTDEQKALIKTDGSVNVFAFHVHQNWGGRYADGGLYTAGNMVNDFNNDVRTLDLLIATAESMPSDADLAAAIEAAKAKASYRGGIGAGRDNLAIAMKRAAAEKQENVFKGSAPEDNGEYYLYNVGAKRYLTGGVDYGTHAAVNFAAQIATFHANGNGFRIWTNIRENHDALNFNAFIDCPREGDTWFLKEVSEGVYTIAQNETGEGNCLLGYSAARRNNWWQVDSDCADPNDPNNQWILVSKEERDALLAQATEENPIDATYYIHAAGFDHHLVPCHTAFPFTSWEWNNGGDGGWEPDYVYEAWHAGETDLHQTLEGLPAGKYIASVQGFYRDGNNGDYKAEAQNAYFYAGESQVLLPNIADCADTYAIRGSGAGGHGIVPDGREDAANYFEVGLYKVSTEVEVGEDGKLTIGIHKADAWEDWIVVDNFRLTYLGGPYTPAEFVSITPAPEDGDITLDTEFVITFTEAVTFSEESSGIGMGAGFVNPTIFEQSEDGKVITAKFDKDALAEMLGGEISDIHALDEYSEGKFYVELFGVADARTKEKLAGNSEDKTPGIFHWEYTSGEAAAPALIVTPAEGTVEKLDVIKFESTGNFIFPSSMEGTDLTITDADGNVVATISQDDLTDGAQVDPQLMYPTSVVVELPEAITAGGTYTLNVPAGAFYMSYSMQPNEATTVVYTIEEPVVLVADPAEGTVDGLQTVTIALSNGEFMTPSCSQDITVADADGNVVVTIDREDLSDYVVVDEDTYMPTAVALPINILKQGTYTMTIPAGTFYCGWGFDDNEETTFTWTVNGVLDGINNVSADENAVIYNLGGQRVKASAKGIVIKNGKKYVVK